MQTEELRGRLLREQAASVEAVYAAYGEGKISLATRMARVAELKRLFNARWYAAR